MKLFKISNIITLLVIIGVAVGAVYYLFPQYPRDKVLVYLLKNSHIEKVTRNVGMGNVNVDRAVEELVKGPTKAEIKSGYFTEIPKGTKVIGVDVEDGTAFVNFNSRLTNYGGGTTRVKGLIAQIVYTLTEFPEVKQVRIQVNGSGEVALGSEGYEIDTPLSKKDSKF